MPIIRSNLHRIEAYSTLATMKPRMHGFTLVELMVTVAIAVIITSMAVPNFRTMLVKRAVQAAADNFVADLRFARSEALRRSSPVSMCSLADNSTTACAGAAQKWTNGWLVFADGNGNGSIDSEDTVLRIQQDTQYLSTIQSVTSPSGDLNVFTYRANGWARASNQTFVFTPTGSVPDGGTRLVCVSIQGRPAIRAIGDSSCGS